MLTKLLIKMANLSKKQALLYLFVLIGLYCAGMTLVLYGAIIAGKGVNLNNPYFISGLVVWIPACIMSILTSISSNYSKEIVKIEKKVEEHKHAK